MRGLPAVLLCASWACGRISFDEVTPGADDVPTTDATVELRGPGTWTTVPIGPLSPRVWTRAVWTGTDFLVFGGAVDAAYVPTNTGARFDPDAGSWTETSLVTPPSARHTPQLALTNRNVVVYGGAVGLNGVSDGNVYDANTDSWTPLATSPTGTRVYASTCATDTQFLVFGGFANGGLHHDTGFVYDLANNLWTQMSTTGSPTDRSFATSIWTGTELIVWGGCSGPMPSCPTMRGDGARYNPVLDIWTEVSSVGVPSPRAEHSAVWTGTEMIVFGGVTANDETNPVNTGAIYTPATDSWRPISTVDAPSPRADSAAVWLESKMLIWGSNDGSIDGYLYDPVRDSWSPMANANAPSPRARFAYASDGRRLFVWGGGFSATTGALWTPEP